MSLCSRINDLLDSRNVKQCGDYRIERRGPDEFVRIQNTGCQHEMPSSRAEWDVNTDVYIGSGPLMSCPVCIQAVTSHPDPEGSTKQLREANQRVWEAMTPDQRERALDIQRRSRENPDAPVWEIMPDNAYAQALRAVEMEPKPEWAASWDMNCARNL